jgi:hypothetical protein
MTRTAAIYTRVSTMSQTCAAQEAQLVEAESGNHIWADRYDGALEDVFELQDKITSSVVAIIEPKVRQAEIQRAQAKPTDSLTAYDLYLRAAALTRDLREEPYREAVALLGHASLWEDRRPQLSCVCSFSK